MHSYHTMHRTPPPDEVLACMLQGGLSENASRRDIEAWAESGTATDCRNLVRNAFRAVGERLRNTKTRQARNRLLRAIVEEWGDPASVAALVLLLGCDPTRSYDEALSCDLPSETGAVSLDVNVYTRNVRPNGGSPSSDGAWACHTCKVHRHQRWFASITTVGSLTHTMAEPTCPRASESLCSVPSFDTLDEGLAANNNNHSAQSSLGTVIDRVGSRWRIREGETVWTTTDVVAVEAGESVLFSPNWFHRVIPQQRGAPYAAVTLRAQYHGDIIFGDDAVLDGSRFGVKSSDYHVCYTRWDLVHALRHPDLRTWAGRRLGIPTPRCTITPMPISPDAGSFTVVAPFKTPAFLRPQEGLLGERLRKRRRQHDS